LVAQERPPERLFQVNRFGEGMTALACCICAACYIGPDIVIMDTPFGPLPVFVGHPCCIRGFPPPPKPEDEAE